MERNRLWLQPSIQLTFWYSKSNFHLCWLIALNMDWGDKGITFRYLNCHLCWAWEGKQNTKREKLESYTSKNGLKCCTFRQKRKRHAHPFHIPNPKQIRKRKVHEKLTNSIWISKFKKCLRERERDPHIN